MIYKKHSAWQDLYDRLKGPDWPKTAPPEVDFNILPDWVQKELYSFGYKPNKNLPSRFLPNGKRKLTVFHSPEHDGGGTSYGQEYINLIQQKYNGRKFQKCYEWCSGPGYIGYGLLDHELCETLCLSDIYDPALLYAEETKYYPPNRCESLVDIYLLKDLALLPKYQKFDLVVSNPPHADGFDDEERWFSNNNRLTSDINWEAHRNFFSNIKEHLLPDGVILLQENHAGSTVETFSQWIQDAGLKITDTFISPKYYQDFDEKTWPKIKIYYIEIRHAL